MSNFDRYISIDINKHFLRLPREQNVVLFSTFRDIIVLPRPKLSGNNPMHDDVVESHRSGHVSEEDPWYAAS